MLNLFCIYFALALTSVVGHSWIACTDVDVANKYEGPRGPAETDPARRVYDPSKCHGYPRGWKGAYQQFGKDFSYNHLLQPGGPLCKTQDKTSYTSQYPKAKYVTGSRVCLQYPSKNHVASPTTDIFMPDGGMRIFRAKAAGETPTSIDDMVLLPNFNGQHQKGIIDYKGFQACPAFNENHETATCTVCFDLDSPPSGEYMFVWHWQFGSPDALYTTCWEADVVNGGTPDVEPEPVPQPSAPEPEPDTCIQYYKQCGGKQWTGSTTCCDPEQECVYKEPFYSACHWKDTRRNCVASRDKCGGRHYQGPEQCYDPSQRCSRKSFFRSWRCR